MLQCPPHPTHSPLTPQPQLSVAAASESTAQRLHGILLFKDAALMLALHSHNSLVKTNRIRYRGGVRVDVLLSLAVQGRTD